MAKMEEDPVATRERVERDLSDDQAWRMRKRGRAKKPQTEEEKFEMRVSLIAVMLVRAAC